MRPSDNGSGNTPPEMDATGIPMWPVETLVGAGREALIRHGEQIYRLRVTAQNKLILTK